MGPGGSVYVADSRNHRVQKFTSEGVYVGQWGALSEDVEFRPTGIAIALDGSVYVSDGLNNRIQKFSVALLL